MAAIEDPTTLLLIIALIICPLATETLSTLAHDPCSIERAHAIPFGCLRPWSMGCNSARHDYRDLGIETPETAGIEHSFNALTAKTAKITSLHTNNVLGWSPYGGHGWLKLMICVILRFYNKVPKTQLFWHSDLLRFRPSAQQAQYIAI